MKVRREDIYTRQRGLPSVCFEDQQLTSFAGFVIFQKLFDRLGFIGRLRECCAHLPGRGNYRPETVLHVLVVHILLGFRRLSDRDFYAPDPLVRRALGLRQLPSVPTMSRILAGFDARSIEGLRGVVRTLVAERLSCERLATVTLDFDGSVLSTRRRAEGTAVGFNRKHPGDRSYYPLFCTVSQTGQVFDILHRSGNVHDSRGAIEFVRACVAEVRRLFPVARIEARMDGAFFSEAMLATLEQLGVEFSISVPFERFAELKALIEARTLWWRTPGKDSGAHFESRWKPKSWEKRHRLVFCRKSVAARGKAPVQLDLFEPIAEGYQFKVIVTNKHCGAGRVVAFHEGRGYQERVLGELKSDAQMDYIPCRRRVANEAYLLSSILAHNLGREVQMQVAAPRRATTANRRARWVLEELGTIRRTIIQVAGRLTRPKGRLTLTLNINPAIQNALLRYLNA